MDDELGWFFTIPPPQRDYFEGATLLLLKTKISSLLHMTHEGSLR